MTRRRRLLSVGAVLAATAAHAALLVWVASAFGARGVGFAFAVNWLAMSWMGIAGRLFPPPVPDGYYAIRPFERSGRVYEVLGVRVLKWAVRRGPLHLFNPHLRLPEEQTADHLVALERRMREPEAAHLWLFFLMLPVAAHAAVRGWWWSAAWTLVFDVVLNAYPVMLQRYNRRWVLERAGAARRAER